MPSTLKNLWARRHLIRVLVISTIKKQTKNSTLGFVWWFLDPMLTTAVWYFLIVVFFRGAMGKEPYLLFLVIGLFSWKAFADSVMQSINSIRDHANIINAISFPKMVLPLSITLSNTVYFVFGVPVLASIGIIYGGTEFGTSPDTYLTWPNLHYFMLPLVMLVQMVFTIGLSLVVCSLGVFFLDTANIMSHLIRLWYFLSPGLYDIDTIPKNMIPIFRLNPFTDIMTCYRQIIMYNQMPEWSRLANALAIGMACLLIGYWIFRRNEGRFAQKL